MPSVADFQNCLLTHTTATAALMAWCQARRPTETLSIAVICDQPAPLEAYDGALRIGAEETLHCRRVKLAWGDRVISEAENWYVPERLPPRLRATLVQGDTPFGAVVAELQPQRQTIAQWSVDELQRDAACAARCRAQLARSGFSAPDVFMLHLDAIMRAGGIELAELREHYRRELLEM